LPVFYVVTTGT